MSRPKQVAEKPATPLTESTPVFTNKSYGVMKNIQEGKWNLVCIEYCLETGDVSPPKVIYSDVYRDIVLEQFRIEVAEANFGANTETTQYGK